MEFCYNCAALDHINPLPNTIRLEGRLDDHLGPPPIVEIRDSLTVLQDGIDKQAIAH